MTSHEAQQARAAVRPVKDAVEDELLARDGVIGVDIGEKITNGRPTGETSIIVFVEQKKPASRLGKAAAVPKEINGVKTDVQQMTAFLQSAPARARVEDVAAQVDAGKYPTLTGGISIGPARSVHLEPPDVPAAGNYIFAGTLGAMVRDRATGATMALTNFHVACVDSHWAVGDRMVQPSLLDGGHTPADQFGSLTRATLSENVDGAVVTLDAADQWTASVQDVGGVVGHTTASVGLAVQKRGRTTEHTYGTVASTDFTVSINYGDGLGVHTLRHQLRITPDTSRNPLFSDHGDSGSMVLDGNRHVVGLLFGGGSDGSTFANPIQSALDELAVDLLVAQPIITRPVICDLRTRAFVCVLPTRSVICNVVVTRNVNCFTTRPGICDVFITRPGCEFPGHDPIHDPIDQFPGQQIPVRAGADGDDFLAGYLTALEAVAAEQQRDGAGR